MGTWTGTPRTWVAGEIPTAAMFNSNLRDFGRAFADAWTAYTPALTASSTNPTNWTATGYYLQVGKFVQVKGQAIAGATMTAGTGAYRFALPVNANTTLANAMCPGAVWLFDSSANAGSSLPVVYTAAATYMQMVYGTGGAQVTVGAAAPWAWGANDIIQFAFSYEAA